MNNSNIKSNKFFSNKNISTFACFIIFIFILIINNLTPMWNDEYAYSLIYGTDYKIQSLNDLLISQIYLYNTWTGRNIVHFFVQLFSWIGKDFFNFLNVLMVGLYIFLIYKFIPISKINMNFKIAIIIFFVWFFSPSIGETFFWLAGSINYLWTTTLMLLFFYCCIKYFFYNSNLSIMLFILAFFVGWSHENVILVSGLFLLFCLIYKIYRNKEISIYDILLFLTFIIGGLILICAPGNSIRNEMMYNNMDFYNKIINFINSFKYIFKQQFIIIVATLLLMVCNLKRIKEKQVMIYFILFVSGFISYFGMVLSPEFPLRATFAGYSVILISFIGLSCVFLEKFSFEKYITNSISIVLYVLVLVHMNKVLLDYVQLFNESNHQINAIYEQKKNGIYNVKVPDFKIKSTKYLFMYPVTFNSNHPNNVHMSKYFGVDTISLDSNYIKVVLDKSEIGMYSIYYDLGKGHNEIDKYDSNIWNSIDGNELYFFLPNEHSEIFRFDPGTESNKLIKINELEVYKNGNSIKIEAQELSDLITSLNDIKEVRLESGSLIIETSGNDPQVLIDLSSYIN